MGWKLTSRVKQDILLNKYTHVTSLPAQAEGEQTYSKKIAWHGLFFGLPGLLDQSVKDRGKLTRSGEGRNQK